MFHTTIRQALEERRLLIAQPFVLIAGILAYTAAAFEPAPAALGVLFLVLVLAFLGWRKHPGMLSFLALATGFCVGFALLPVHAKLSGTPMLYGAVFGQYSARVDAIHSNDSERARIILSQITPVGEASVPPVRKARILIPSAQLPRVGDTVEAPMRLYRVPGPVVPGGFDSQFHAFFSGIGAFGSATGELVVTRSPANAGFSRMLEETRQTIGQRIDANLSPPVSGIARALIIGDQGQVDETIRNDLAGAGLAHVLAISGLHLSLVAGGVFAALRMALSLSYVLSQSINVKKVSALGGMAAALIYLGLSGASVSAIRATLMLLLVFGAVLAGRRALTMRNVAFAALAVILLDPASVFRPSFQLSFAAVVALVGAYEGYRPAPLHNPGLFRRVSAAIGAIALTSLIAGAATALFAAYHFQQIAPLGVLGNIVAIPLVALVVLPAAFLGVLAMPFGFEPVFFAVMGQGISTIVDLAYTISHLNTGFLSAPLLGPGALLIALAGLAWFAFFPGKIRLAGVGTAAILVPMLGTLPPPDILIADTTKAVVLRNSGGQEPGAGSSRAPGPLELVAGRLNSFAVRAWSETYMEPIGQPETDPPCDISGCFFDTGVFRVALVTSREGFFEDCFAADLVISRLPAPARCREVTQVIDENDLQTKGVHWLKWTGESFWIRPAITDVHRPWRPRYPR